MTDIEKVKLLAGQLTAYSDDEIQAFLDLEGGDVRLATATALEALAANQAYVLKVIQDLDIKTDGAKVAEALLKAAERVRAVADSTEEWSGFDIAEITDSQFARREKYFKELLREDV